RKGLRQMRNSKLQPESVSKRQSRSIPVTCVIGVICRLIYNVGIRSTDGFEMVMQEHSRPRARFVSGCRIAVVLLAIGSLTLSLATRYTALGPEVQPEVRKITALRAQSANGKRQHLLGDGFQWTAPAASFTLFQPPRPSVFTVSAVVPSLKK